MKKLHRLIHIPFDAKADQGMTIIEILIVIALMSTIMAVLVGKLLDKSDSAKADLAKIQAGKLDESLSMYRLDTGRYPASEDGLQALLEAPANAKNWKGPYSDEAKLKDPWGNQFQYAFINPRIIKITSAGSDGEFGTEDDLVYPPEREKKEEAPVTAELTVPEGNLNSSKN